MQIRWGATGIEILAPAKINLFFEVLNRREDGFHEIESLIVPINIYDTLYLEKAPPGKVSFATRWIAAPLMPPIAAQHAIPSATDLFGTLPQGEENHAIRAIRLLAQRAGIVCGAKLHLVKRIPAAAGLGGGSSDAAAALLAANCAWKLNWSIAQLATIAAEIGSDVPFFLLSRPAICRGRGEIIEPVSGLGTINLVVVRPPEGLNTAAVYRQCQVGNPPLKVDSMINALRTNRLADFGRLAHNRLLAPARTLSKWVDHVLDVLKSENCPVIGMTGSGSSCFAICRSAVHARHIEARLKSRRATIGWVQMAATV
ncbi:MAG TPA: 4-(cytidine 5'-diphospho)-2-C-methyl-D-erythritol kinase [Pirellulales bacterium]